MKNRRPCIHERVGPFVVTVGYDPETWQPCEVFISERTKSGTELEQHLYDLGVAISKIMQNKPTDTEPKGK